VWHAICCGNHLTAHALLTICVSGVLGMPTPEACGGVGGARPREYSRECIDL